MFTEDGHILKVSVRSCTHLVPHCTDGNTVEHNNGGNFTYLLTQIESDMTISSKMRHTLAIHTIPGCIIFNAGLDIVLDVLPFSLRYLIRQWSIIQVLSVPCYMTPTLSLYIFWSNYTEQHCKLWEV